jgi:hypothetical protein
MKVQMEVAIDVVQRQSSGAKFLKLSVNFPPQLVPQRGKEKIPETGGNGTIGELLLPVHQTRNGFLRQGGMPAEQGKVETHTQPLVFSGQSDRLFAGRFVYHQAGAGENALAMSANHGGVDAGGTAKVVGVDDQAARRAHEDGGVLRVV